MTNEERRVADLIREAFQGVTLGDGIGLFEAQGLDDYECGETLAKYRAKDEKNDWSAIPAGTLNQCNSSLSFFDPAGMRFHLPAFLLVDLEGTLPQEMDFKLGVLSEYRRSQLSLLSPAQRDAIREFLVLCLQKDPEGFNAPSIRRSVDTYWAPSIDT
ncbi:MAG TPA: DUF6714 family protein [Planctomycetaceae bacterium]|nr:DUF6714 family protein [Planctomycetaceae bacterium]